MAHDHHHNKDTHSHHHHEKIEHDHHHKHKDTYSHHHHEEGGCACCEADLLDNLTEDEKQSKKPIGIFLVGIILIVFGYLIETIQPQISQIIFFIAAIFVGKNIIKHGILELFHKKVKIELLVTISTFGAFLLNSSEEGALLMALFYLGEYLEEYSLNKSKRSIVDLVKLTPDTAEVKHGEHTHEKPVSNINIGDIVVVKPGDKIPVDGVIVKGQSSINQSSITGESLPVFKKVNDEVYASTINEDGYIEIKVEKSSNDTIFAKIIELIKNSAENKAKIDLFIDKFAEIYTPIVIILAILVAVIPALLGYSIYDWTYRALTLLVISCPCALVISTPVSIVSAITKGTRNGIIIKGGEYLESLAGVKEILFDKTGTLTEGNLKIDEISNRNVLKIACSLEAKSNHPIAQAFNEYREKNNIELLEVTDFESIIGIGLKGKINNIQYYIGKRSDKKQRADTTEVIIKREDELIGSITLTDKIRSESKKTINTLKKLGVKTGMITGDNNLIAGKVADELNLDTYYGDLLPEEKVNIVKESVQKYGNVCMVGDGVNDTPSLAMANVGIAMGLEGADVAIETADIVLLEDKLSKIVLLVKLARKTMSKIKFNVVFCLTVKSILIILGILGYVNLWEAVLIGDMGITLIVVGNSLLLAK